MESKQTVIRWTVLVEEVSLVGCLAGSPRRRAQPWTGGREVGPASGDAAWLSGIGDV
jgi:hypothetical protein